MSTHSFVERVLRLHCQSLGPLLAGVASVTPNIATAITVFVSSTFMAETFSLSYSAGAGAPSLSCRPKNGLGPAANAAKMRLRQHSTSCLCGSVSRVRLAVGFLRIPCFRGGESGKRHGPGRRIFKAANR